MSKLVEVAGVRRARGAALEPAGAVDPAAEITVALYLKDPSRPRRKIGSAEDFAALARPTTRAQLARERLSRYAQASEHAEAFARQHGLQIADVDLPKRRIRLRGSAAQISEAFGTELIRCRTGLRSYRAHTRPLHLPGDLAPWIRGVLGLDTKPLLRRLRAFTVTPPGAAASGGLWPAEIARLYGIQATSRGAGQCIGIIAPRGGYLPDDLALAAQHAAGTFPEVAEVMVDLGRNAFGGGTIADQELALDLQVVGAVAPAAKLVVYFTDDSEQGLADAVLAAVHDTTHRPHAISISWGVSEQEWAAYPQALDVLNGALADSVRLSVIVTAASGDMLATDAVGDDLVHVNYPASSPYVLSCGGTRIDLAPSGGSIASEVVWNDGEQGTGGGVSDLFDVPDYQQNAAVPVSVSTGKAGRGVPDVAATAAFVNGYRIFVNRQQIVQGGTSAVAPLWAGFVALINAERGVPLQRIHPSLYGDRNLFRAITQGNNKSGPLGYDAGPGWNACTGLGVPVGARIVEALTAVA
jgi:kumamolisin